MEEFSKPSEIITLSWLQILEALEFILCSMGDHFYLNGRQKYGEIYVLQREIYWYGRGWVIKKENWFYMHTWEHSMDCYFVLNQFPVMPFLTIFTGGDTPHFLKTPYKCPFLWHHSKSILPQGRTNIFFFITFPEHKPHLLMMQIFMSNILCILWHVRYCRCLK